MSSDQQDGEKEAPPNDIADQSQTKSETPLVDAKVTESTSAPEKTGFAMYSSQKVTPSRISLPSSFTCAQASSPNPFQQVHARNEDNIFDRMKRHREISNDGVGFTSKPNASSSKVPRSGNSAVDENPDNSDDQGSQHNGEAEAESDEDDNELGSSFYSETEFKENGADQKTKTESLMSKTIPTGEENEIHKLTLRAKLYIHDTTAKDYWKERGTGILRLNEDTQDAKKSRLIMRCDGTLRVILNVRLVDDMVCELVMERDIRIHSCCNSDSQHPEVYLVRLRNKDDAETLLSEIKRRCTIRDALGSMPKPVAAVAEEKSGTDDAVLLKTDNPDEITDSPDKKDDDTDKDNKDDEDSSC